MKKFGNINRRQLLGGAIWATLGPKNICIHQAQVFNILNIKNNILYSLPSFNILDYGFPMNKTQYDKNALREFNKRLGVVFPGENISDLPSWEQEDIELWMKRNYNKQRNTYFQIHGEFISSLPLDFQKCLYIPNSHICIADEELYQILKDIEEGNSSGKSDYGFFSSFYSFKISDIENEDDTIYLDLEFQNDIVNIEGHVDEGPHWCNQFSFNGGYQEVREILSKPPGELLNFIKQHTSYLKRIEELNEHRRKYNQRNQKELPDRENPFKKFLLSTTSMTPISQYKDIQAFKKF